MRIPISTRALVAISTAVLLGGCWPWFWSEPEEDHHVVDASTYSDVDVDSDSDTDSETEESWVGIECEPPGEDEWDPCPALTGDSDSFCFAWEGAPGGFCTKQCSAATYEVPVQDGCHSFDGYVCMDISHLTDTPADDVAGYAICVEECSPQPLGQDGPCKASYQSCNPRAWAWESQWATCLLPKCQANVDCLVPSGPKCAGDLDCLVENGEFCDEDERCVFVGVCDAHSGRCTWEAGDPDAEPGDPCETAWDCGANYTCVVPAPDEDGKVVPANGYCASFGCKAANSAAANGSGSSDPAIQDEFACGMLGTCHAGFHYGGMCMKRCNPPHDQDAFKCRQQSWDEEFLDVAGDYDCYDQTAYGFYIPASGNTEFYDVAPAPSCTWITETVGDPRIDMVNRYCKSRCGDGPDEMTPEDCADYYGGYPTPWGLSMTCRDPETGHEDPFGYCLDLTTSGPTGHEYPGMEIEWIEIPIGGFEMGSPDEVGDDDEHPQHLVFPISGFELTRAEITVYQYAECVDDSVCSAPGTGEACNWGVDGREDFPANCVSWTQAVEFCAWVEGRLPTEAEWEYAARGGDDVVYPWGDETATCDYAVMTDFDFGGPGCGTGETMEACSKPAGDTTHGLCDMSGNVMEWVQDQYHDSYVGAPNDGSAWEDLTTNERVTRGGGYQDTAYQLRAADRSWSNEPTQADAIGFRCAR